MTRVKKDHENVTVVLFKVFYVDVSHVETGSHKEIVMQYRRTCIPCYKLCFWAVPKFILFFYIDKDKIAKYWRFVLAWTDDHKCVLCKD